MPGNKVALVLALICASVASFIVYKMIKSNSQPKTVEIPKTAVVIAKTAIPTRTVITEDQVEIKMVPKEAVNPGTALKLDEVVGLITKNDILEGEQVNTNRLVKKGEKIGLAFIIPPGMRAITIAVNEVAGVAGFVKPGEKVDVIGTMEPKKSEEGTVGWTVIQDVEVLAVAQDLGDIPKTDQKDTNAPNSKEQGKVGTSVTLAVTPDQAQKIALAEERGVLRLTLRPAVQEAEVKLNPVKESQLIPYQVAPRPPVRDIPSTVTVPAPTPRGKQIEVISGGKSQIITVY